LIRELLIFDWLRCGHHFLPDHFEQGPIAVYKKQLWKNMPLKLAGVYDYKSRDEFFKQGVFMQFSGSLLQEISLSAEDETAYICFQPEREKTVFRLNSLILLPPSVLES